MLKAIVKNFLLFFSLCLCCFPVYATLSSNFSKSNKIKHEVIVLPNKQQIFFSMTSHQLHPNKFMDAQGYSHVDIKDANAKLLGQIEFDSPYIGMKSYQIAGLPSPLIIFVSIHKIGASSVFYTVYPYAILGDKIQLLWKMPLKNWSLDSYGDGFYIGKLPGTNKIGLIFWKYIFKSDESHMGPHTYSFEFYQWNGNQFVPYKTVTTQEKFPSGVDAIKAYGGEEKNFSEEFTVIEKLN